MDENLLRGAKICLETSSTVIRKKKPCIKKSE